MNFRQEPKEDHGFIYILSNPSMPGVYKVGLTTNSLHQRTQNLNNSSIPKDFIPEKIFEIPEKHLRKVEKTAHNKLKSKGYHFGKEYFEASLDECLLAVQDSIYEITRIESVELVGQAKERERLEGIKRDNERRRRENEERERRELQEKIAQANAQIEIQRTAYIKQLDDEESSKESFSDKFIFMPLGVLLIGAIALGIMSSFGPLAWFGVPAVIWWLYKKDNTERRDRLYKLASEKYPYVTAQNYFKWVSEKIDVVPRSVVQETPKIESKVIAEPFARSMAVRKQVVDSALEKRLIEIEGYQEVDAAEWITNHTKTTLLNIKTGEVLYASSPLGFSISSKYFVLNNKSSPRKLRIESTLSDDLLLNKSLGSNGGAGSPLR